MSVHGRTTNRNLCDKLSIALYPHLFSVIETNCVYAISFAIEMKDRQILFKDESLSITDYNCVCVFSDYL